MTYFKTIPVASSSGFVCYFDILGYSSFILESSVQQSIDDFAVIRSILLQSAINTWKDHGYLSDEESFSKYVVNPFDSAIKLPFRYIMDSDSVFYWGMDNIQKLTIAMKSISFSMFMMAIRQTRFVRGAVARGILNINPLAGIYFGKPIVECASIEKRMTAPGVIIPLRFLNKDESLQLVRNIPYFVPVTYTFKDNSKEKCLYINWIFPYARKKSINNPNNLQNHMEEDGFHKEKIQQLMDLIKNNDTFPFPVIKDKE